MAFAAVLLSTVSCRSSRSVEVTGCDSMRIESVREMRAVAVVSDTILARMTLSADTVEVTDRKGRRVLMTGVSLRRDLSRQRVSAVSVAGRDTISTTSSRSMVARGNEDKGVAAPSPRRWLWPLCIAGLLVAVTTMLRRR